MDRNLELLGYSKCPRCGGDLTVFFIGEDKEKKEQTDEAVCDECGSSYILIYKNGVLVDYVENDLGD